MGSASLHFEENEKGSIERGKLADLILVDRDPLTCRDEELRETQVLWTMVGRQGRVRGGILSRTRPASAASKSSTPTTSRPRLIPMFT